MRRFGHWLIGNADGTLALFIAISVGLLGAADVLGSEQVDAAILLTLALLATTLLRDRQIAAANLARAEAVRLVQAPEAERLNSEAQREASVWIFKGGTGTHLRTVTLRGCVTAAREANRPVRMQIEILDPTDTQLCRRYAEYRAGLRSATGESAEASPEVISRNAFATILAVCWYRQRFVLLQPEIGLSRVMTTFRWDISPTFALMTQEDRNAPGMYFDHTMSHYRAYQRELAMSFEQSRRLDLSRIDEHRLADEPTPEQVRRLFGELRVDIPLSVGDNDVADIIRRAALPDTRRSRFGR
ncbi:hypothetical protein [Pseudonocardia sp. MH-G8]|uniref:hypothetical protein n=1 Tax=Pseudonocardia sp. MH-G8 TaxID=1854588 RepID=UPI000B9FA619|nr:hypothetical protein [Pseudonocardia sp. MH-G8]OZM76771.1 hypothetical protein CFP66_39275 [Pseudonocardia sp. MH-G8]